MIGANDWMGVLALSALFGAILVAAELWRRFGSPDPEWTRKLVHVAGGLACLAFPFWIESPWVVLGMASSLSALFLVARRWGRFRSLHGVGRVSRGVEYYPLAIFLVFLMARDRSWLYVSSVLVLAVCDALAALIGTRYGTIRYEVEDEKKSLEGSVVFAVFAFLSIHLPLLLLSDLPRPVCVLSALLVSVLVTGFEAISLRGTDNLFVPLAVCVILDKITAKPLEEIVYQNLSLAAIVAAVGFAVWRSRSFNVGGAIVFMLFAYATWSLGSELWALPVLLSFGIYAGSWLLAPIDTNEGSRVRVRIMTRALLPSFLLLVAANATGRYGLFYGPYLATGVAVTAFTLWSRVLRDRSAPCDIRPLGAVASGLLAWGVVAVVPWLVRGRQAAPAAVLALLGVAAPLAAIDDRLMGPRPTFGPGDLWPSSRVVMTLAAGGTVLLFQALRILPAWPPAP